MDVFSLFIVQNHKEANDIEVCIGDTDHNESFTTDNTQCYAGGREGITPRVGSGQNSTCHLSVSNTVFRLAEAIA